MEPKKNNTVPFPGSRIKTKHWSNRKKFITFSGKRLLKLKKIMASVRALSNKKYYDYTEDERKRIIRDMGEWYQQMYRAWRNAGKKEKKEKKTSYWDIENGNN